MADEYQKAREELDPLNQQAKDMAGGLLDSVGKALSRLAASESTLHLLVIMV